MQIPHLSPPPQNLNSFPSVLTKLLSVYKNWHKIQRNIPTLERHSLGIKTDSIFVETIHKTVSASLLSKDKKFPFVQDAILELGVLNFFITLLWEMGSIDTKKYSELSELLSEIGRMLGGWKNQLGKQNLATYQQTSRE